MNNATKTPEVMASRKLSAQRKAESKIQRALAAQRREAELALQALRCVDCGRVGAHECPPHAA